MVNNKHILVLGVGSVGNRHLNNMLSMNCILSGMDPDIDRLNSVSKDIPLVYKFTNINDISKHWHNFDGVIVCSPTKFHKEQCIIAAKNKIPILLEKPLTKNLDEGVSLYDYLNKTSSRLMLGYTYRWWMPLIKFRDKLKSGKIGKPLHAKFIMSAHLADWHPWERYQDFFMSSVDLGGGALLDESHFIDLMIWMFGFPDTVNASVEKISDLDIQTDDNVDILIKYNNGLRVMIHLDLYGRPHEKYISITGDQGTIKWSFDPNSIQYSNKIEQTWEKESFNMERNSMFINVAQDFLKFIDGNSKNICDIDDGLDVMRVIEACRLSSNIGEMIKLNK